MADISCVNMRKYLGTIVPMAVLILLFSIVIVSLVSAEKVNSTTDSPSDSLTSGARFCQGQKLHIHTPDDSRDAGATYQLISNNSTGENRTVKLNETGQTVVNTSELPGPGSYVLRDQEGEPLVLDENGTIVRTGSEAEAAFRIVRCQLSARFEVGGITAEPGVTTYLTVNATLTDTVVVNASGISDRVLAEMVNGSVTPHGVRITVPEDERIPVVLTQTFVCQSGVGNYTVTVKSDRTGARASDALLVTQAGVLYANFEQAIVQVEQGDVAEIPVEIHGENQYCPDGHAATLIIGSNVSGFQIRTDLYDQTNDSRVVVRFHTGGTNEAPVNDSLTVVGNDSLRNSMLVTTQSSGALEPGHYEMRLLHNGSETSVGRLTIRPNQNATRTPTLVATTTDETPLSPTKTSLPASESETSVNYSSTTSETGPGFAVITTIAGLLLFSLARVFTSTQ